jgi:uncharacterized surface protein with fasciclin (FAS1) repeats
MFVAALVFAASTSEAKTKTKSKGPRTIDLTDTVLANRILTKFAALLRASDLGSFLSSRGPFTLFAPTDSAFSRIPPDIFAALQLPQNKEVLQKIILFHIVNGRGFTVTDLGKLKTLPSCEGHPLPLRINHVGYQVVGRAKILHGDMHTLNGIMDEIDTVLVPPGVSLSALATAPAPVPVVNTMETPAAPTNAGPEGVAPNMTATPSAGDTNSTSGLTPVQ